MDELLVDPDIYPDAHRKRGVETSLITPIRHRDHSKISALFPHSLPDPNASVPARTAEELDEWRWYEGQTHELRRREVGRNAIASHK